MAGEIIKSTLVFCHLAAYNKRAEILSIKPGALYDPDSIIFTLIGFVFQYIDDNELPTSPYVSGIIFDDYLIELPDNNPRSWQILNHVASLDDFEQFNKYDKNSLYFKAAMMALRQGGNVSLNELMSLPISANT